VSDLVDSQSFALHVKCVTNIAPAASLSDVTYFVGDDASTIDLNYILTPETCHNNLQFTVTQADDSALPASISISGSTISV
jgi:hypothetical protein